MEVPEEIDEECHIFEQHEEEDNQHVQEEIRSDSESDRQSEDGDYEAYFHFTTIQEDEQSNGVQDLNDSITSEEEDEQSNGEQDLNDCITSEEEDEIPGLTSSDNSSSEEETSGEDSEFVRAKRTKKSRKSQPKLKLTKLASVKPKER